MLCDKFEEYARPSIDPSWSFISSLLWLILSATDTYLYQWRKLKPYNRRTRHGSVYDISVYNSRQCVKWQLLLNKGTLLS